MAFFFQLCDCIEEKHKTICTTSILYRSLLYGFDFQDAFICIIMASVWFCRWSRNLFDGSVVSMYLYVVFAHFTIIVHYCLFGVIFIYFWFSVRICVLCTLRKHNFVFVVAPFLFNHLYTVTGNMLFTRQYSITSIFMTISILSLFDAYFMSYIFVLALFVRVIFNTILLYIRLGSCWCVCVSLFFSPSFLFCLRFFCSLFYWHFIACLYLFCSFSIALLSAAK